MQTLIMIGAEDLRGRGPSSSPFLHDAMDRESIINPSCLPYSSTSLNMPTDLNGKPFQLTFVRPAQMMLFANVVCHPPLGQATVVREDGAETKVCQAILLPLARTCGH